MRKNPELLAPAGSTEALVAALRCGADAVYLGATQFSARRNAKNFDLPALHEAAQLCHLYGAKLYLTLNTLLFDEEYTEFLTVAEAAAAAGVDAFIMQDLGAVSLVRQLIPEMPVHASTQMSIHTPAGIQTAQKLGITRVVAARELAQREIAALCSTGMEIEVFCHGALCMSFSGQCYLSAMIGSRSANRGRCAQACRLPFSPVGDAGDCALSLRDLCLAEQVNALCEMGVASLKIEGRMKRPEYVAAAVTAYRKALAGEVPDYEQLRAVFSRSGFTDGYFTGERRAMFGVRAKEDVVAAKDALPALAALYQKPRKVSEVQMKLTVSADQPSVLELTDEDGNTVQAYGETPVIAENLPLDEARALRQLQKLGDSVYSPGALTLLCEDGLMLPARALNALRRDAVSALDAARMERNTPRYTVSGVAYRDSIHSPRKQTIWIQAQRAEQVELIQPDLCSFVLLPVEECTKTQFPREQLIAVAPRMITDEPALFTRLSALYQSGVTHLLCENLAHIALGSALGFTLHGGFGLNLTNSEAFFEAQALGLTDAVASFELRFGQLADIRHPIPVGLIAHGRFPVMLTRLCPVRERVGCKNCTGVLRDRTGRSFSVRCHNGYTELLNAEPLFLADRLTELTCADYLLLLLEQETPEQAAALLVAYTNGAQKPGIPITRGLYYRGVQ